MSSGERTVNEMISQKHFDFKRFFSDFSFFFGFKKYFGRFRIQAARGLFRCVGFSTGLLFEQYLIQF